MKYLLSGVTALGLLSAALFAQHSGSFDPQPYAGLESREIASLSDQDIEDLLAGRGWGLALPAELNGMPGPTHVLELADQLNLSAAQRAQTETIFNEMRAEAQRLGQQFVDAEAALTAYFVAKQEDEAVLQTLLNQSEELRGQLRFIHLSRHIEMTAVLSDDQIAAYQRLRGYDSDPCENVPNGHDASLWKLHNGCS